jgi:hypothetical protein
MIFGGFYLQEIKYKETLVNCKEILKKLWNTQVIGIKVN